MLGGGAAVFRKAVALIGAFVLLSLYADSGTPPLRVVDGTVTEWSAGELIAVANEHTDPGGIRIRLRNTTFEGEPSAIEPGVRVTVSYRIVGERLPVAVKVRLFHHFR